MDCICDKFVMVEDGEVFDMSQAAKGDPGPGVAPGGTTGQLLAKASDTDYDTEWIDAPDMDAGGVTYDPTEAYDDGTVGKELTTINSALTSLSAVTEIIDTASGAIASFPDGSGLPMRSLVAQINPVQDLHGQSNPWPAGGGKNKLQATSSSATVHDVTFTVNSDGSVMANGTADSTAIFDVGTASLVAGSYYISGSVGGSGETYYIRVHANGSTIRYAFDGDNSFTLESDTTVTVSIYVLLNVNVSNKMFYPMIRPTSVSDATYAPYANLCPISGHTGVRVYERGLNIAKLVNAILQNDRTKNGITFHATSDNSVQISGTATGPAYLTEAQPYATLVSEGKFYKAGTYTLSSNLPRNSKNNYAYMTGNKANGESIRNNIVGSVYAGHPSSFTIDYDFYANIQIVIQSGETIDENVWVQLEPGSVAHAYEAFKGIEPISVSFGTTVYGGTDEVVSGNGTSTMGMVDMGTLTWKGWEQGGSFIFYANIADKMPVRNVPCKSSQYAYNDAITGSWNDLLNGELTGQIGGGNVYVRDNRYSSIADFKTAMSGVQLVYPLATPQSFTHEGQEISTLYGQNNVWVDTGSVEVTYPADTKLYIDKKIAELGS